MISTAAIRSTDLPPARPSDPCKGWTNTHAEFPAAFSARLRLAIAGEHPIGVPLPPLGFDALFGRTRIRVFSEGPRAESEGILGPLTVYFHSRRGGWVAVT